MKKTKITFILMLVFVSLLLINLLFVFDWENSSWENNKGAYLTTFSNGLLFISQLIIYVSIKKKEHNAA